MHDSGVVALRVVEFLPVEMLADPWMGRLAVIPILLPSLSRCVGGAEGGQQPGIRFSVSGVRCEFVVLQGGQWFDDIGL